MDSGALGKRIRYQRQRLGMTQMKLAELVGISYQQIQKYETGNSQITVDRLVSVARALKVTPTTLIPEIASARVSEPETSPSRDEITAGRLFSGIRSDRVRQHVLRLLRTLSEEH